MGPEVSSETSACIRPCWHLYRFTDVTLADEHRRRRITHQIKRPQSMNSEFFRRGKKSVRNNFEEKIRIVKPGAHLLMWHQAVPSCFHPGLKMWESSSWRFTLTLSDLLSAVVRLEEIVCCLLQYAASTVTGSCEVGKRNEATAARSFEVRTDKHPSANRRKFPASATKTTHQSSPRSHVTCAFVIFPLSCCSCSSSQLSSKHIS